MEFTKTAFVLGLSAVGVFAGVGQASAGQLGAAPATADTHGSHHAITVRMQDDCDPITFNAVLGDGACVGDGETTFGDLVSQLLTIGQADKWTNKPHDTHIKAGQAVSAVNRGGEAHSFTEVATFGGGCVPEINALVHLNPVAECATPAWVSTIAPPGGSVDAAKLAVGTHKFECLIHPWMHTTVTVRTR